jgi:DNA polymerase-3 subunit alpha
LPIVAAPKFFAPNLEANLALDALWCIKNGTYLVEVDRVHAPIDAFLSHANDITKLFEDIPQAIENAQLIAAKCNFSLDKHAPRMPGIDITEDASVVFAREVNNGLEKRLSTILNNYSNEQKEEIITQYKNRIEHEINMINKMGFCEYFLIVAEIVQWAKKQNISVGAGRGSGASCLAAFCLEITNIDPIRFNLMFERFLNPDRVSLPDFDIDFCQERRYEVIEYIQKRFGFDNVAHIVTFGSLQYRAAIRDIGRVMQIPYPKIDLLCKQLPQPVQGVAPTIKQLREDGRLAEFVNNETKDLLEISESVEGLPRHSSVHAAGLVIGNSKLSEIVPLFKDPNFKIPIIQFSLKSAEEIGLVKFDILGLSTLSSLQKTCEFLKEKNIELDLDKIPLDDQATFHMLQMGIVKAVFQLESPGFRNLIIQMQPTTFEDIIAAISLYRPGPMVDIPQFIKCKHSEQKIEYLYPQMEDILKETYGVIVYQEHVIAIAKEIAGYSLKDADSLRRVMGKKIKAEMVLHEEKFIQGVLNIQGGSREKAKTLFDILARFASYGFPKAHAAPYALTTYQTAYCKCHHTAPFLCAMLFYENTQEKAEEIIQEAKKMGVPTLAPCINTSSENFTLNEDHTKILYGLSCIKGIGKIAHEIIHERNLNGLFKSVDDLIARVPHINKKALENFVFSGAFDCFSNENIAYSRSKQLADITDTSDHATISLFDFNQDIKQWSDIEIMRNEFETIHTIFNQQDYDLTQFNIKNKLQDIIGKQLLIGIGLGKKTRKTNAGRILNSYQFIDNDGVQELLFNNDYDGPKWEKKIFEIEKQNTRFVIKKIYEVDEVLEKYRKIFICVNQKINLEEGNTSIYFNETKELLGNYKITIDFLINMKNNITYIQ